MTDRETPDPLRWWVEGALERVNDLIEAMRVAPGHGLFDVREWLQDGLDGKPVGLTAVPPPPSSDQRPTVAPKPPRDREVRETPAGAVEALAAALKDAGGYPVSCNRGAHMDQHKDGTFHIGKDYEWHSEKVAAALTASGYSLTRSVDVERWQRIETAARNLDHVYGAIPNLTPEKAAAWKALQEAIEEPR